MAGLVGQTLDHYRLVEQLGQGGMATVYRAQDLRRGVDVAIKVLSPTITGEKRFVRRFRREAEIVKQRLKHPNIVPVLAYGETGGYVYLVMPLIQGETLSDRLVRRGLTEQEANLWVGQICDALDFAHKQRVIHRDIKPANIMLTESGEALLMDFGLARDVEGSGKLTGSMLMGTPAFVSPEQAQGKGLDHRSDQYSLGVVLYLIATGHLPFDSDSPMALVLMHIQDAVPKPSRFNPSLKPALERVILKTLAKDLEERFKDTADLKRAYAAALAGDSVAWVEAPTEMLQARRAAPVGRPAGRRPFPTWLIPASALPVVALLAFIAFRPGAANEGNGATPTGLAGLGVATRVPASTALPTASPAPTLTPTPVEAGACPGLGLITFSQRGNEVSWTIDNSTGSSVQIANLGFGFPADNQPQLVSLDGEEWLDEREIDRMVQDMLQGRNPEMPFDPRLNIVDGELRRFGMRFKWTLDEPGLYELTLEFDSGSGGCVFTTTW
jgi:hypothetical protein